MASTTVEGFLPSRWGFHFANSFPQVPVKTISLPGGQSIPIGDASGGLCGGMIWAARDFFEAQILPPPDKDSPPPNSKLFNYLVDRLIDSFDLPFGLNRYFEWMQLPDADDLIIRGVAQRTLLDEWPQIKADIDSGHPSPLGVVTRHSHHLTDMKFNHQVLAYGYDISDDTGILTIHVYDPNHPDDDTVQLTITPQDQPPKLTYSDGLSVRGVFHTRYRAGNLADAS